MDGTNPKISFIPKESLVREDSFLERRRPRSLIGIIAIVLFVVVVAGYAVLYYFNNSLGKEIQSKTNEIRQIQQTFTESERVGEAKTFSARAGLVRELLDSHTAVSPVLVFLSQNTVESILYNKFNFSITNDGALLELGGEAPSYATLAYQGDILRTKTAELVNFSIKDITLTDFGSVSFELSLLFKPDYLLYSKNLEAVTASTSEEAESNLPADVSTPLAPVTVATTTETSPTQLDVELVLPEEAPTSTTSISTEAGDDWVIVEDSKATTSPEVMTPSVASQKTAFWDVLWSWFKFW